MKSRYLFTAILVTGGITLGLELVASRVLTPFFGVSLFVWSSILSITLIALALGYRFGGVLAGRMTRDKTLLVFAASSGLAALWLDLCLWTYPFIFLPLADFNLILGSIAASLYLLFIPLLILSALNPLLVALLSEEQNSGDHGAGSVFFISTIGSVFGVFIVAYGLLPYITNYQTIMVLTLLSATLSLLLLSQIQDFHNRGFRRFFAAGLTAFLLACATLTSGGLERYTKTIHYGDQGQTWHAVRAEPSSFGHLEILDITDVEGHVAKRMLLNDSMIQNIFYSTGLSAGLYTYALERLGIGAVADPRKALVLGIGAGIVPMTFMQDSLDVHAVDINDKMVKMAEHYFDFQPSQISIEIADARTAARHCQRDYDIVAVDLFRDDGIPEHLVTREFFNDIKNCMNDHGVIVMNSFMSIKKPIPEYALLQTIASVFGEVYYIQKCPEAGQDFTSAFIVARKGGPVGRIEASANNMPPLMAKQFSAALNDAKIFKFGDPALKNAPVLSDVSNQWKHLAYTNELSYRRLVLGWAPWQILMN